MTPTVERRTAPPPRRDRQTELHPAIDSRVPAALIPGAHLHVEAEAGHPPHDEDRATQRITSFLR